MLLRVMPSKPRSRGDRLAVEGKAAAGERAGAERQDVGAPARLAEALPIAREHLEIGEQVVRPQHGLRAAHVRVAGDHGVGIRAARARAARPSREQSSARTSVALLAQPQARIERDLLVAAAAGVDLVGDVAGALFQLADDQRVDVLVGGAFDRSRACRLRRESASKASTICARSSAVRMPTRSSARAKACEPRMSQSISRRSKSQRAAEALEDLARVRFQSVRPRASFRPSASVIAEVSGAPRSASAISSVWS